MGVLLDCGFLILPDLRGLAMRAEGAVWSVWTGRRAAGVACLASICCAWGVGLCWDVVNSALTGICSSTILAKGLRDGRGGVMLSLPLEQFLLLGGSSVGCFSLAWDVERGCDDGTTCVEGVLFGWEPPR
eukprot:1140243-Pelagomonas_calceolata.AAC.1